MAAAPTSVNLLSDLPDRLSSALLDHAIPKHLTSDEVLFLAGDPGDGFYRLDEGLLKVSIASATGAERILAILGPGAIVGDLAIIDGLPRSASVSALRDCKMRFVSRILNDWMRAKIITRLSGYYCLEDPKKLEHEIEL